MCLPLLNKPQNNPWFYSINMSPSGALSVVQSTLTSCMWVLCVFFFHPSAVSHLSQLLSLFACRQDLITAGRVKGHVRAKTHHNFEHWDHIWLIFSFLANNESIYLCSFAQWECRHDSESVRVTNQLPPDADGCKRKDTKSSQKKKNIIHN